MSKRRKSTTRTLAYLNGEFAPMERACVPIEDRGFQFGDGVYEVIRVYGGRPFALQEHMDRLTTSLRGIDLAIAEPIPNFERVFSRLVGGLQNAFIYIQVTRGTAPRLHAFPSEARPTVVAYARKWTPPPDDKTYSLLTVVDDRWARCNLKTVCLLANVLGKEKAVRAGCDEGLYVRDDGTVTEGTTSNAFLIKNRALVTHPANNRILNGVTRLRVLGLARDLGIRAEERPFVLREAFDADEFFITGSTSEIMPVRSIDGRKVGSGRAGPLTEELRAAFRAMVARECGVPVGRAV